MHKKPRNIIFFFGLLALVAAGHARAQLSLVPDPVQYIVSPETPGPGDKVSIEVQGVGGFLGDAGITWSQNGKVVLNGVGATDFSFVAGALGTQTSVHVQIVSPTEGTITHDFIFSPALVNLIWEADTTAPPLYRGKSLYSAGSALKVVAFPTVIVGGAHIPGSSLSFEWSLNDNDVPSQSGLGRSVFSFTGDQLQPSEDVAVDVLYGANKVGHSEVVIPASQPFLLLYDQDPLRGTLYDSALPGSISLGAKEITLQAAPYFFSNASLQSKSLQYSWTLDGEDSTGPQSAQGVLTLRQTGSGQGSATVEVSLQNNDTDKLVHAAQATLQMVFGSSGSNSLFGL